MDQFWTELEVRETIYLMPSCLTLNQVFLFPWGKTFQIFIFLNLTTDLLELMIKSVGPCARAGTHSAGQPSVRQVKEPGTTLAQVRALEQI